jgi:transposase-like protein
MKAVAKAFPNAIVQRCVVHVKRQIKNYLGAKPQLQQAKELLYYSRQVTRINSLEQAHAWLIETFHWYTEHEAFINQKSQSENTGRSWYTHKHLHHAATHLINAIPQLFSYLNDEQIPKSTNQIEGYFAHLKEKLTLQRGLRFEAKKNFIKWYLYFKNQEKRERFLKP